MNTETTEIEKISIDAEDMFLGYRNMAEKIQATGESFDYLIGVNRGGLIPLGYMSYFLNNRHTQLIDVETYDGEQNKAKETEVFKKQSNLVYHQLDNLFNEKKGEFNILIIDDLIDTGLTIDIIREAINKINQNYDQFKIIVKFVAVMENLEYVNAHDDVIDVTYQFLNDPKMARAWEKIPNKWIVFPWDRGLN